MVMMKPRKKVTRTMIERCRLFFSAAPRRSPIGVIAISAPSVKNIIPMMIRAAPMMKHRRMLEDTGAIVKHRKRTIPTIGITATSASRSFSRRNLNVCKGIYLL